jgi:hypothetical protein
MMKKIETPLLRVCALTLLILPCGIPSAAAAARQKAPVVIAASMADACSLPTRPAGTQEETAWRLFVAINCKTGAGDLTWETWTTQACLNNPADCRDDGRLHASALRASLVAADKPRRTAGCSPMTTNSPNTDPSLVPFVPANLSARPVFCEEMTISPGEEAYSRKNGLLTQAGQVNYLRAGKTIDFPADAIEVKANWVPASSFSDASFDCARPNGRIYLEMIDGECYALAAIDMSSKLYPDWLWASFEPQYPVTNPNRCDPELYNSCTDTWGSNPATSTGQDTAPCSMPPASPWIRRSATIG